MKKSIKLSSLAASAVVGAVLLTGCGSDSSGTVSNPTSGASVVPSNGHFSQVNGVPMADGGSYTYNITADADGLYRIKAGTSYIDSNGNKKFDENDTALMYDMITTKSGKVHPMLSAAVEKNSTNPVFTVNGVDLSTFDPIDTLENATLDANRSLLNLAKIHKLMAKISQTSSSTNAIQAFKDLNISEAITNKDANISNIVTTKIDNTKVSSLGNNIANIVSAELITIDTVMKKVQEVNTMIAADATVANDINIRELVASVSKGGSEVTTALTNANTQIKEKMLKPEFVKAYTEKSLEAVKRLIESGDTNATLPPAVIATVKAVTKNAIDLGSLTNISEDSIDSNLTIVNDLNTSAGSTDINITELNTTINTTLDAEESNVSNATNSISNIEASIPVALKLSDRKIIFGSGTTKQEVDLSSLSTFSHVFATTSETDLSDYFTVELPIDKTLVDKNSTDNNVSLIVEISNEKSQSVSLGITGAKLETIKADKAENNEVKLSFLQSTTGIMVSQTDIPSLQSIIGTEATSGVSSDMTTEDFKIDLNTLLDNLSVNQASIKNAMTKLNDFLTTTDTYTVKIGFDANATTDFDNNLTIGSYSGLQGISGEVNVGMTVAELKAKYSDDIDETIVTLDQFMDDLTSPVADTIALMTVCPSLSTDISWASSNENAISTSGTVTRPETDTSVTLTATITKGSGETLVTKTKSYTVTVAGNPVSATNSSLSASDTSANFGGSAITLTALVKNDTNDTVEGKTVTFSGATLGDFNQSSSCVTDSSGLCTIGFTPDASGTDANNTLTATVTSGGNSVEVGSVEVSVENDPMAGLIQLTEANLSLDTDTGIDYSNNTYKVTVSTIPNKDFNISLITVGLPVGYTVTGTNNYSVNINDGSTQVGTVSFTNNTVTSGIYINYNSTTSNEITVDGQNGNSITFDISQ